MSSDYKVLSITAAQPGWVSRFKDSDGTDFCMPVAVWAVIEDVDGVRTVGMSSYEDVRLTPDDLSNDFQGWEYNPVAFEGTAMLLPPH